MANGKSYTDAILEFNDRLDMVEQRILARLDKMADTNSGVAAALARGDARFTAHDGRIRANADDIECNRQDIKKIGWANGAIALVLSTIASIIGVNK